jgi:hypothetical protein
VRRGPEGPSSLASGRAGASSDPLVGDLEPEGTDQGITFIHMSEASRRWSELGRDGGDEETRTPDPLLAKEMLCQLSYVPGPPIAPGKVVGVSGLEPETSALSGQCSNQLS